MTRTGRGAVKSKSVEPSKPKVGRRPRNADPAESAPSPASLVNAVSRALSILDCFEHAEQPLGNRDIALRTGLPKSTVSRITRTLTELGYLHARRDIERYYLGPRLPLLARAFERLNPLPAIIQSDLQTLATATRATVGLGVVEGLDAVYRQIARGVSVIMIQVDVGTRIPLLDSALGLALIVGSEARARERILAGLKSETKGRWPDALRRIRTAAAELAEFGYCTSIGAWSKEINGVAAPFRMTGDRTTYAANIGAPTFLMDDEAIRKVHGPKLLAMIADLESRGLVERIPQPSSIAAGAK